MVEQVHGFIGGGEQGNFPAWAYHGYWALDFTRIDPNYGDEESLKTLVDEAHKRGMRIILDVVMNHAGYATPGGSADLGLTDPPRTPAPADPLERMASERRPQLAWLQPVYRPPVQRVGANGGGPDWVRSQSARLPQPGTDDVTGWWPGCRTS